MLCKTIKEEQNEKKVRLNYFTGYERTTWQIMNVCEESNISVVIAVELKYKRKYCVGINCFNTACVSVLDGSLLKHTEFNIDAIYYCQTAT